VVADGKSSPSSRPGSRARDFFQRDIYVVPSEGGEMKSSPTPMPPGGISGRRRKSGSLLTRLDDKYDGSTVVALCVVPCGWRLCELSYSRVRACVAQSAGAIWAESYDASRLVFRAAPTYTLAPTIWANPSLQGPPPSGTIDHSRRRLHCFGVDKAGASETSRCITSLRL
jgi:hypothetical protein